jgi:uncharacterized protein (TIGR04255 family)
MPKPRHLRKAPISEAVIDLRVRARSGFDAREFARLRARLADRFPRVEERRGYKAVVELAPGTSQTSTEDLGLQGYFYKSEDEKNIAQFRIDGFTFNRLKPYTSWNELFPLAMDLWRDYCSIANPEVVARLALRYINHIPLPPGTIELDEYLRAGPVIPPELPQHLGGFVGRLTIHDPQKDIAANISQALEGDESTGNLTLLLDIDAFRQHEYSPEDPEIEATFQGLRSFKNRIFFSFLTDKALGQFE